MNRRSLLKIAGTAAGAAAIGAAVPATSASAAGTTFAHPGLLHTRADLDRMAAKVKAGANPYTAGFAKLTANRHSQTNWKPNPQATIYRGAGHPQNYATPYNDIHAAYQNALRGHVTGEDAHLDTAVAILNAWSAKLTSVEGSPDRFLASGLYGYQFANAAELVRDHADFDLARFQKMMLEVFSPLAEDFLKNHNGAVVSNYWTNWDLANEDITRGGTNQKNAGVTLLLKGTSTGLTGSGALSLHQDTSGITGWTEPSDKLGSSVVLQDLSGWGRADLAIGTEGENGYDGTILQLDSGSAGIDTTKGVYYGRDGLGTPGGAHLGQTLTPYTAPAHNAANRHRWGPPLWGAPPLPADVTTDRKVMRRISHLIGEIQHAGSRPARPPTPHLLPIEIEPLLRFSILWFT
ncbi:hypothetical protein [Streptomyces ureilyticus]|uniref:hypothetical protein n=1 Tax=Streptomyces ureilyticus TaxID=1775131 RepID=UPI001F3F001B|nr:hypothetical protein [Streptomyces ureilyticus]